jgi:hypothetical protein
MLCNQPIRLAYQPPASSTFLSEQISHQQPANSTFLSEQTSTSHQPTERLFDPNYRELPGTARESQEDATRAGSREKASSDPPTKQS